MILSVVPTARGRNVLHSKVISGIEEVKARGEQIRFKKLGKEMKSEFKWLVSSVVIEYWQENRQIPFGEEMSKLRTRLLRMFAEEYSILLKDDTELKNYLLMLAITTINKHLKSENKKRVSKLSF